MADSLTPVMRPTAIDLRALYRNLYETLPWPEPIPRAEMVTFLWGPLGRAGVGSCNTEAKIIRVSIVYQDERLRRELHDLMAHEASHFIWASHSKAFKDFLRGAGVAKEYVGGRSRGSEALKAVEAEWLARPCQKQIHFPFDDTSPAAAQCLGFVGRTCLRPSRIHERSALSRVTGEDRAIHGAGRRAQRFSTSSGTRPLTVLHGGRA